ncbi:MAG: sporulation integral membrane protein YtvI [Defluviitaleaceae bacterium]|nr:sporulation integral membrane protein YtvI [Defluviitaleaceae bacterium]
MHEFYFRNQKKVDMILFVALVAITAILFFRVLFPFLSPFFFGLIIALLMEPLVKFFVNRFKFKRWIASLLCLAIFLAAMGSLGVWLVNTLARQVIAFEESAPAHVEEIVTRLEEANQWLDGFGERVLPANVQIPNIEEMALSIVSTLISGFGGDQGIQAVTNVVDFFINLVLAFVSAYFFMADRKRIFRTVRDALPKWVRNQADKSKAGLTRALGGYFRAQGILMAVVAIISISGLLIMRNPYALLLGLLFAVLDFLPILGPTLILLPWALISLVMGDIQQAIGLTVIFGVITVTRQVLQPKILGAQMGAHPLASLMSIFIGFRIFGLLGFIIGPTLLMIFIAIHEANFSKTT